MSEQHPLPSASADHDIVRHRLIMAPPERIFGAFADPSVLARWWGPKGFTNTIHAFDFRSGGVWRFTMHGPDGASYAMDHRFIEITPPARVVVRHLQPGHDFTLSITLTERDGGTEIVWRMRFDDPAEAERLRGFLERANEENLDRLAAQLSSQP